MQLSLRRASPDDAATLALIGAASFLDAFIFDIPGPEIVAHCARQHSEGVYAGFLASTDPRTACWIAEIPGTRAPVGYLVTRPPGLPGGTGPADIEIKRIYCLSRMHGCGAGQALMDVAVAHARACAAPQIWLGTYQGNNRAIAFYRRNRFATVATRQFQVGDAVFDDIVMARPAD